jgi:hypothetical protein
MSEPKQIVPPRINEPMKAPVLKEDKLRKELYQKLANERAAYPSKG